MKDRIIYSVAMFRVTKNKRELVKHIGECNTLAEAEKIKTKRKIQPGFHLVILKYRNGISEPF